MEKITYQIHQRRIESILQNIATLQAILNFNLFEIISTEFLKGVVNARIKTYNEEFIVREAQKYLPKSENKLLMPSVDESARLDIKNYRRIVMLQNKFNNIVPFERKL
jgi:hypothetical protein